MDNAYCAGPQTSQPPPPPQSPKPTTTEVKGGDFIIRVECPPNADDGRVRPHLSVGTGGNGFTGGDITEPRQQEILKIISELGLPKMPPKK